jgi:uncharacterized protein YdhG (YjbR/CyaY superfamily)
MAATKKSGRSARTTDDTAGTFTDEERAAMRERSEELRKAKRRGSKKADGESDLLAKIAEMPDADRVLAERIHAIVKEAAPDLEPKTWYGMPAYAKDGKVLCFFQSADKFKARYATFGFNDNAVLDEGAMWPTSYALVKLGAAEENAVSKLVRKAVG